MPCWRICTLRIEYHRCLAFARLREVKRMAHAYCGAPLYTAGVALTVTARIPQSSFPWEDSDTSMNGIAKVGLFIDLENIRYELIKRGREFDPQRLIQKARKYGLVKVAYAYADFTKQPELLLGKFEAAMINRVDVPLRQRDACRLQSSADLHMVLDVFETVLFNGDMETFILGTGDKDFTRVSAMLVNRFGKRVIICGVPGSISQVLVDSATIIDPLDPEEHSFG